MMDKNSLNAIDGLEIEPLSDELLAGVAGATSSGASCCSCSNCSNGTKPSLTPPPES
ncbi:MAG: hypothetical protein ABW277_08055 [Longimicrobiaceae bacterium]